MFKKILPPKIPFPKISLRDIFLISGVILLGYGLWLLYPWLGYAVCGLLFLIVGLFFMKEN